MILKKNTAKRKKKNLTLLYPGPCYAHKKINFACKKKFGKCLFAYKTRFAVGKNWGYIKITGKMAIYGSHTFSICGSCMISIFFQKTKKSVFLSPDFF